MVKLHIIGGPGSGKTTLACALSSRLNVPHYDLDILGQKNGTNPEAHIEDSISISKMPGWVVEGIYVITIDPLLYEADYIVLLDVAWSVAAWRIIKRHIIRTLHGTNQYPGLKGLFNFLAYSRSYYLNRQIDKTELVRMCLSEHSHMALPPTRGAMVMWLEKYHEISIPPTVEFVHAYLEKYSEKVFLLKTNSDRARLLELLV